MIFGVIIIASVMFTNCKNQQNEKYEKNNFSLNGFYGIDSL